MRRLADVSISQHRTIMAIADALEWNTYPTEQIGNLLWVLLRYYVMRLGEK